MFTLEFTHFFLSLMILWYFLRLLSKKSKLNSSKSTTYASIFEAIKYECDGFIISNVVLHLQFTLGWASAYCSAQILHTHNCNVSNQSLLSHHRIQKVCLMRE